MYPTADEKRDKIEALTTRYATGQFSECVYRASLMHLIPPDEIRHLIMLNQTAHRNSIPYCKGDVT